MPKSSNTKSVGTPRKESIKPQSASSRPSRPAKIDTASALPRPDTKLATVYALIAGAKGATLGDLTKATGWLPHTTRAALSGLRKRGFVIAAVRADGKATRYHLGPVARSVGKPARRAGSGAAA